MKIKGKNFAIFTIALIFTILILFPIYILFRISVSAPQEIFAQRPSYLIRDFNFGHFADVLNSGSAFFLPLRKSLVAALGVSIFSLLISIPAAYALSKFNYKVRYALLLLMFVTRMVPEISIALPVSIVFIRLGLFDTTPGLILAHLIRVVPVSCFILTGVFSSFPQELERQARIDGCSRMRALKKVVLPLSLGGISVAGIFSFLLSWDEFIYASYLSLAEPTMPLKMYYYVSRGDIFYSATYAVIITIPVLLFTFVLQKYIKPGYLAGAVKG